MDSRTEEKLAQCLKEMKKEELRRFLHQLSHKEPHSLSTSEVPSQLLKLDAMEVASHLVSQYGEQKAWDLALHTWEQMGLGDLRAKAQKEVILMPENRGRHQDQSNPTQSLETEDLYKTFTQLLLLHRSHQEGLIQRNLSGEMMDEPRQFTEIAHLFDLDPGAQKTSLTVLLCGEAGVGKSTLARQVRAAWGEGHLFRDRFQHVFYIKCGELDKFSLMTLAELIQKHSAAPVTPIEKILSQPEQLLFILDGLDDHRKIWEEQSSNSYLHWHQRSQVHILLKSLLEKTILAESCLLITVRTIVMENLIPLLENVHCVEVLGFSESNRKDYFYKYFTEESQARRALSVVESNPALWTLCLVPWVSWLACTCLKQQMEQGQELSLTCQTTTALCLQFLSQSLPDKSFGAHLRSLCSLAAEGTQRGYTRFTALDPIKHNLDDTVISTLLKMDVLQQHPTSLNYSFTCLCFQEFFTAMYCVLEDGSKKVDFSNIIRTAENLLSIYGWYLMFRAPTMRFLFGLLSEQGMRAVESLFNCTLSPTWKWDLLKWTQEVYRRHSPTYLNSPHLLHCLYEIQDVQILVQAMLHFRVTKILLQNDLDLLVFMFCIKFSCRIETLQLKMGGQYVQTRRPSGVALFTGVPVTDAWWQDLFSAGRLMKSLKELDLSGNFLSNSTMQSLCNALKSPLCHLETLCLENCGLTSGCCKYLASVLRSSSSLKELNLQKNDLYNLGVKLLYEAISLPSCQLRSLWLDQAQLSEGMIKMLKDLKETKPLLHIEDRWLIDASIQPTSPRKPVKDTFSSLEFQSSESEEISSQIEQMKSSCLDAPAPPGSQHMKPIEDGFWGPMGPVATELVDKERSLYRVHFPIPGSYHWPNIGLHFVVKGSVTIEIEFCDWKQFLDKIVPQENWMVAGPLFDIKAEPGTVAALYLPHFVSFQGGHVDTSQFRVAHFKMEGMVLEQPTRVVPCYTVLENPGFSPMGVLLRMFPVTRNFIPITTIVLLYHKPHPQDVTFHLYLIPNDGAIQKAIDNDESLSQFVRIRKPPPLMPLHVGSHYTVSASQQLHINSPELKLCYRSPREAQLFSEIYVDQMGSGIILKIKSKKDGTTVWETLVRPGDLRPAGALDPPFPSVSASTPDARNVMRFLEQNRNNLVTRVTTVDPLLDKLLGPVLSEEEYKMVQAEDTTQKQMRRLFSFSPAWDLACKNCFFQALQETHPHLIGELLEMGGTGF
ncbi:NACHT, LRR and PYD domains-containing protein 1-like [Erinaceus europaeus]|uniref:NACHT, LRR and PYD domains-containing protein 1-like n=1 Tax=Erinaceus europaeus TaxID=9365 RepID=A0ABM3YGJ6_ERIEU|nr:NACHT, LRR and PYD domains-containing protein 1-like [Erinaceus europaeus]